jgi:hypothetical protein
MGDKAKHQLIDHLQSAFGLCDGAQTPTLAYLIARALDEAHAIDRSRKTSPTDGPVRGLIPLR